MSLVSKNIFWLSISRVLAMGLLFFAYTRLFRYLGPVGSGQYQFVLSFALIFTALIDLGLQQYIVKQISEDREKTKKYFYNFLAFEILIAPIIYGLVILLSLWQNYETVVFQAIVVAGLGVVANALSLPFLVVITAWQDLRKVALVQFVISLINTAFILTAVILGQYIVFLSSALLAANVFAVIAYSYFARKFLGTISLRQIFASFNFGLIKNLIKFGYPFMLLVGFSTLYNRLDIIIIRELLDYKQVGLYSAAYKFFDFLSFFPTVVYTSIFPFLTSLLAENNYGQVRISLEKYLRMMGLLALPMAVGGMILAPKLMLLIAGEQFLEASSSLAILVWASCLLFIYIPVNALVISRLTKAATVVTGSNVAVNIAGNIILIPILGIKAAAIMTVISELIQAVFYFYLTKRKIVQFGFLSAVWKPALAAVLMGVFIWPLRDLPLLITMVVGGGIYFLTLWLLKFISKDDLVILRGLVSKY